MVYFDIHVYSCTRITNPFAHRLALSQKTSNGIYFLRYAIILLRIDAEDVFCMLYLSYQEWY